MAKLASKRYSKALFDLCVEENILDEVYSNANMLCELIGQNGEIISFIKDIRIDKSKKKDFIKKSFDSAFNNTFINFIELLIDKDRIDLLQDIIADFISCYKEYNHIGIVYISSATNLSDDQKSKLESKIISNSDYETLETHYDINKSLIGGISIKIGDKVVDATIKTKIDSIKKTLDKIVIN